MSPSNQITLIDCNSIIIPEDRQRKSIDDLGFLMDSIQRVGLLHPITITRDFNLISGERRLTAWKKLNENASLLNETTYSKIPCQFIDTLDQIQKMMIELDENIRRKDITWQEQAQAVSKMHDLLLAENPLWTQQMTADRIGLSASLISQYLAILAESKTNETLLKAPTRTSASLTLKRIQDRRADSISNSISDLVREELTEEPELGLDEPVGFEELKLPATPKVLPASDSIQIKNCIEFFETYSGERFNFLHCDFPYGIGFDSGWDNSADHWGSYEDSPEVYWTLLNSLIKNWDRVASSSSHLMFWFSMRYYSPTMQLFSDKLPQIIMDDFPLIWHKTDNKGSLPDPNRGPRRVYETALFGACGDRKIVKACSNTYGAPTNKHKAIHISEKPEPVLRYFFSMFVDGTTRLLDPTCGSGTSLRAAESLGADHVLGLELNPEYAQAAIKHLDQARALEKLSKEIE